MALMQKRDDEDREYLEGVEIIERSDVPEDEQDDAPELVAGASAEDIAAEGDAASRGGDADDGDKPSTDAPSAPSTASGEGVSAISQPSRSRKPLVIAGFVIAIVVAAIVGYFVGSGGFAPENRGLTSSTITEDELDTVVASYTYNGTVHDVTAREALESEYSLSSVQAEDGTYPAPSATTVLTYARNRILLADAEARGIEVSDDEVSSFAESNLGTSDFSEIASSYGVSEDQAKDIVRESAMVAKLYEQIAPEASELTVPTQPTAPENGDESTASSEYATYIIDLLGDEWDTEAGTWARTDGDYYAALGNESFTADSATYAQAITAYYVAYQQYAAQANEVSSAINDYANALYANVDLTIYGLYQ